MTAKFWRPGAQAREPPTGHWSWRPMRRSSVPRGRNVTSTPQPASSGTLPSSMAVALTAVVLDSQSNQSFEMSFERFPVRIGRNQLADLHIDRPYVSQFHAAVEIAGSQIWLKDLGS